MMDYTGVTLYPVNDTAEKRKPDATSRAESSAPFANRSNSGGNPVNLPTYQPLQQDASIFRFRDPLAPPNTRMPQLPQPPVTPLGLLPANLSQLVNANMEKLAGQIISFFNGNRKEKPSEEERLKRQLNDAFGGGFMGEVTGQGTKVEAPVKSQMQDGE